jgi:hypothetical protein
MDLAKKLVADVKVGTPYLLAGWTEDKSEMLVTLHVPVKSHFEFVESPSE